MDLNDSLEQFKSDRVIMVDYLENFTEEDWQNEGLHPEYKKFTAEIFIRHIIMHDHLHMYRIEELWLANEPFINK